LISTRISILALAASLAGALLLAWQQAHWSFVAGTALSAGAPLAFVLRHRFSSVPLTAHPLSVSVASGLGCVAVMVAETRFGPNHGWALFVALAALVVWMLWQRGQRGLGRTHRKRRLQSGGE
jgi:peptidoglycan/LPS O-acetylase OafA/YrhL